VKLYPAIDILGGKVVRLRRGDFAAATVFADDPLTLAHEWQSLGAEAVHVVDLDAARSGELVNFAIVEQMVAELNIPVQYGGGVRTARSLATVAGSRIRWVVMGTAAVTKEDLLQDAISWLGDRLVVGVDCDAGLVSTHGWQRRAAMSSQRYVNLLEQAGVKRIVYTDITRDGMLSGPNFAELAQLAAGTSVEVVLSGGVGTLDDLRRARAAAADAANVVGVIVGRALYENVFTLAEATAVLAEDPC
jgi:phosphoribosylformimino-5-aminoimidazole carboxamide ribotide isomerase